LRMGDPAIHKTGVAGTGIEGRAVTGVNGNVSIDGQVFFCARSKSGVQLETNNAAAWPNDFRNDRGVVAHATSQVKGAVARLECERLNPARQRARLAIVDVFRAVERDDNVVIQVAGIHDFEIRHLHQASGG
jgi:hypothetical protein